MTTRTIMWAGLVLILGAACTNSDGGGEPQLPIDDATAKANIDTNLRAQFEGLPEALREGLGEELMAAIAELGTGGVDDGDEDLRPPEPADGAGDVDGPWIEEDAGEDVAAEWAEALDELVDAFDELLADSRIVSQSPVEVVYRLDPSTLCELITEDEYDAMDCAETFEEIPLHVRVTSPADGDVTLRFLAGDAGWSVVTLKVLRTEVSVMLDFFQIIQAVLEIARAQGEEVEMPATIRGQVELALRRTGEAAFELALSIPAEIRIDGDMPEGPVALSIASTRDLALVGIDGAARQVDLGVNVGVLSMSAPAELLFGEEADCAGPIDGEVVCEPDSDGPTGRIEAVFGGLTGRVSVVDGADRLKLTGVSLGAVPTKLVHDGRTALALEVNGASTPAFDLEIVPDATDDGAMIRFSPGFDVSLTATLGALASHFDAPEWMRDDALRITLDGAPSPTLHVTDSEDGGSTWQVAEGSLSVSAESLDLDVTVEAGMCFGFGDAAEEVGEFDGEPDSLYEESHPFEGFEKFVCGI